MNFPKMTAICICGGCGRTVEKNYVFCPWCGHSRVADEESQDSFESAYKIEGDNLLDRRYSRIEQMEEKLNNLEKELKTLSLSAGA